MFLSLCDVLLRWVLQLAVLRLRSNEFKGARDRRAAARTGCPPTTHAPSGDDVGRPPVLGGGESAPAARPLAVLPHHTRHAAAVASSPGGEAVGPPRSESVARRLDVRSERWSSVSRARTRGGDISGLWAN